MLLMNNNVRINVGATKDTGGKRGLHTGVQGMRG